MAELRRMKAWAMICWRCFKRWPAWGDEHPAKCPYCGSTNVRGRERGAP